MPSPPGPPSWREGSVIAAGATATGRVHAAVIAGIGLLQILNVLLKDSEVISHSLE